MRTNVPTSSIWIEPGIDDSVKIIDQRFLPHELKVVKIYSLADAASAIRDMQVRGAPLIGVTAAFGFWLGLKACSESKNLQTAIEEIANVLVKTRPTAVNLQWAIDQLKACLDSSSSIEEATELALKKALEIRKRDIETCEKIGSSGLQLIDSIYRAKAETVNILTHCNAGWLACVKWGTATSPIYQAHKKGIPIHVWVDETRPRNQGANLTAWELGQSEIPHTVITDNAGGHLMQKGRVDLCLVGSDRTTRAGDVANKIGTYLKALAANDNNVPFYVCLPSSTIDWKLRNGLDEIPIEERGQDEVSHVSGIENEQLKAVRIVPRFSPTANPGFDVTPARLVTGLITERGICKASEKSLIQMFPEHA